MRLQAAAGHPELALRQYDDLVALLDRELETRPSEETVALAEQVRRQHPAAAPAGPAPPSQPTARPAPSTLPSEGTFSLLFADAGEGGGATQLPESAQELLTGERRANGGTAVRSEAPFIAAFTCAESALACAAAAHRARQSGDEGNGLRLAVETSRLQLREGRYHGAVLRHASRLLKTARPGQVLCSERTAALASLEPEPTIHLVDLGLHRLRDEQTLERLFAVETGEGDTAQAADPEGSVALPAPINRFFGREQEPRELEGLLTEGECRLVTLLGPSGIGKSRLAFETAKRLLDAFPEAVWFVPLADLTDSERLVDEVLRTVRPQARPGNSLEQLVAALAHQPGVLVLDNVEHLLPAAPELALDLLQRAASRRRGGRESRSFARFVECGWLA